ncbi:Rho1 guanine nucleotide exchange factor 1 [Vairimorpha necatrix]|uniref:Rho1 guanine nucleotide exchange factor 1 n=1 Tax=Vairimorpha necatrix TaxID=6039 RepID=A0AAX4JG53_9MICR
MPNPRKRIEAISEMFISEKTYISDLILWESEFRKSILNLPFLSLKVKYEICDAVFINMHEIRLKHGEIFEEMKSRNLQVRREIDERFKQTDEEAFCIDKSDFNNPHVLKLEYATIFFKYSGFIYLYRDYFSRLPKAEYELERVCYYSPEFKKRLEEFLYTNNIEYLGVRNFLYRPSTKLARLPLLLKAISKNEGNPEIAAQYELLIDKIKKLTLVVDDHFAEYSGQFKVYRLSQRFKYEPGIRNQLVLGLFQKKRKLLKEGDLLFKSDIWALPVLIRIYIFDNCIIFSEKSRGEFTAQKILYEPLFLERLIYFDVNLGFNKLEDEEQHFFPLFLLETSDNIIRTILFEDFEIRKIYKNILFGALKNIKKHHRKGIEIIKVETPISNILCACKTHKHITLSTENEDAQSSSESQITNNENTEEFTAEKLLSLKEFKNAVNEYSQKIEKHSINAKSRYITFGNQESEMESMSEMDEEAEKEKSDNLYWLKALCYKGETFYHVINDDFQDRTENQEYIENQNEMMIVSTKNGIFLLLNGKERLIYPGSTKKVLYDTKFEILMFQTGSILLVCNFNHTMDAINPIQIKNNVGDFFYGSNERGSFIATRNYGSSKSSLIYLFHLKKEDRKIKIDLSRKLYVGFKLYNIIFCPSKIVIACKDFEIVDMETLKTEEFLELYNPCVPMLLSMVPNAKAMSVFTIDLNTFIVCFDAVGFYTDKLGKIKKTEIVFLWKNTPVDFKLCKNKLITLSKNWIDIFDINTGNIIFSDQRPGLKFVRGTEGIILHDDSEFYKILM